MEERAGTGSCVDIVSSTSTENNYSNSIAYEENVLIIGIKSLKCRSLYIRGI